MAIVIDTKPLAPSLRQSVESLQVGQSLCAPGYTMPVVRTTASRVQAQYKGRRYRCKLDTDGPRVWRLT